MYIHKMDWQNHLLSSSTKLPISTLGHASLHVVALVCLRPTTCHQYLTYYKINNKTLFSTLLSYKIFYYVLINIFFEVF